MRQVTLLELRKNAERILRRVSRGESLILTRRGRPVARLEPLSELPPGPDDPIYRLAVMAGEGGKAMTNREMDRAIYGL